MGSSSGKVWPESSSQSRCVCFFNSVVNFRKREKMDGEVCAGKKTHAWIWRRRRRSDRETSKPVKESVHPEERRRNAAGKFRAKFDPRVLARYEIKALIGRGAFSRVVRAEHRRTHRPCAIKLLEVRGRESQEACRAELEVLRRVNHANVVHLSEAFETRRRVYLVLELATGGELLERVLARGTFRERDATLALRMVLDGLGYLHTLGVVHRDLKPENLLYYHPGPDSRLIITDFGLACWDRSRRRGLREPMGVLSSSSERLQSIPMGEPEGPEEEGLRTLCGTAEYLAPEMLSGGACSCAVDLWALGVITFTLLSGALPFDHTSRPRLFRAILRATYCFSGDPWSSVSSLAKSFIERLLTVEAVERMTAEEALHHPWLLSMAASSSNKNLHRSISRNLQQRASRASSRCPSRDSTPRPRPDHRHAAMAIDTMDSVSNKMFNHS